MSVVGFFEHLIAFAVIFPWVLFRRKDQIVPREKKDWGLFVAIGVGGSALGGALFSISVEKLGPQLSTLFTMLQPLFVLGFAQAFLRERGSALFVPCALWVVANSVLMSLSPETTGAIENGTFSWEGCAYAFAATAIWGGSTVAGKALTARYNSTTMLFWRWIFAMIFLGTAALIHADSLGAWRDLFTTSRILSLLYLGVFAQTAAYWIYYQGLRKLPASLTTFLELVYPLSGVMLASLTSGEGFTFWQAFGAVNLVIALTLLIAVEYPRAVSPRPDGH